MPEIYSNFNFINCRIHLKRPGYYRDVYWLMKKADFIFDITYGDSFSDIYGKGWLIKTNIHKQLAVWSKTKFLMLPQTYGPFRNTLMKEWSLYLIKKADKVYSRDKYSADYVEENCGKNVEIVTDLAFALPYETEMYQLNSERIRIGLNPSSLLWDGGKKKNNLFGLTVNYQVYCRKLIQKLETAKQYEIHLIPHVIEDIEAAMKGMLDPIFEEQIIGHAVIRQTFKASGVGTIAGSYILDGKFQRGCKVRITRDGEQIFDGPLASLKRFKDDVKEVNAGYECGLVFEKYNDVQEDDMIEAYAMVEVPR